MAELALELLNLMAAFCILYCVVRLTPTLNLRLQRRAVQLLLLATTTFFINEVLGVLGVFWVSEGLAVLRDGLEMTFIFSLAIALLLLFQSDRCEVATLNQAATVDRLTGLRNFGYFKGLATQRVNLALAGKLPLSLILLDADNFKSYNDTYGHEAGNIVLRLVATVLQMAVRAGEDDIVARYGGEEFVVLLSCPLEQAVDTAERIRAAVAHQCQPSVSPDLQRAVTVSVGVAALPPGQGTLETLVEQADQAMYRAKRAGKNRVGRADQRLL
jgi:diguanylate cyclase (GGDEF)-like protein